MPGPESGGRIPRVSRLMALAIKFERLVREGTVHTYRQLAEAGQISRARMSQIMHLSDLAPEIQEELLFLPKTVTGPDRYTEKQMGRSRDPSIGSGRRNSFGASENKRSIRNSPFGREEA
jgi:hypothetical protein